MSEGDTLPLTTGQRGVWASLQIAPKDAIFNIAEAVELHGVIDAELLRQALRRAAREIESTRVRIVQRSGPPRQVVLPDYEDPIAILDFSGEPDPFDAAMRWMTAKLSAPADLEESPLWVSAILKVSDDSWFYYQHGHHIAMDGFTASIGRRRVAEIYTALRQGRAPSPACFEPISTLIESEAAYRASDRYGRDRAFWMERMANLPELVTLARRSGPARGGLLRSTQILSHAVATRLREQVKGMNVSLPRALIALVATYFFRITGAEDLVFGLPVTARTRGLMWRCPGMVANAVPIRLAMSAEDSFEALVTQVSRVVRDALRHQQYRYEDLRRDLGFLTEDMQGARLGVNIEPFDDDVTFNGVPITAHNLSNAQMVDLMVFIYGRPNGRGLRIDFDANPGLYSKAELDAHQRRLRRLVEALTLKRDWRLGEVDILDPEERVCVTRGWNDTSDAASVETVPEMFARQAARSPNAPAVILDARADRALTYRALCDGGDALAGRLARRRIGPGDIVAVALPRSELIPVALLGIMKAGSAYLPLDPDGPRERMSIMLEDAAPACVLTLGRYASRFEGTNRACLFLDDTEDETADMLALPAPSASATAYVIYTSGSTGRPKGVEVSHGAFSNLIEGMKQLLEPGPSDRLLSVTTITFDVAGAELFLPLAVGGQLVIASQDAIRDPLMLGGLVQSHDITLLHATPSFWRMLLANRDVSLSSVHAMVSGEALSPELAGRMLARARKVTNLYGPTETTIWSTYMDLSVADIDPPPIGRPIRNTQVYVLDGLMQVMPVGAPGALYIGGAAVAKGYLNQKALTDERFVPDPFTPNGGKLYNTGDVARWREDGVLEYLGRRDQQVKIRGHRIELGDIETHLARCEGVAAAAVTARPEPSGERTLIAYVVPTLEQTPSPEMLREHLLGRLPSYMVPSDFVTLDALPQTPNGKLDRMALSRLRWSREQRKPTPARTDTERRLVAIWTHILRREDIGIFDNFFELGGDSLKAAELFVAVSESFAREIPYASLFRASTIACLAALLDAEGADDALETLLPLKTEGRKSALFCVHPIFGLGWPYAALVRQIDPDQPLYALQSRALRSRGEEPVERPTSIEEIAADYVAEIRRAQPHGPYHLLGWSFGGLIAHAMAARLRAESEEVAFLALLDSYPIAVRADARELNELDQVELALAFLGLEPPIDAPPPRTMTALAEHLCVVYGVNSLPLAAQAVFRRTETDFIERLGRLVLENLVLASGYDPAWIDVDVIFCHAAKRSADGPTGLDMYQPGIWRGRSRRLIVYDIPCHHQDILSPRAAERIGAIIRDHLGTESSAPAYT